MYLYLLKVIIFGGVGVEVHAGAYFLITGLPFIVIMKSASLTHTSQIC